MPNESAIIVPMDAVEPIVGRWRRRYDPGAALGVPPHITLIYPFCHPRDAVEEIETLARLFSKIEAFHFAFTEVRRFTRTAYLHPDKPEPFVQMTKALMEAWPVCKPYNGAFTEVIPHLTVADQVDANTLTEVESCLAGDLPVACVANQACLMLSDESGQWSKKASFPFLQVSDCGSRGERLQRTLRHGTADL